MAFLKKKYIKKVIETLKGLEKKDKTTERIVASKYFIPPFPLKQLL